MVVVKIVSTLFLGFYGRSRSGLCRHRRAKQQVDFYVKSLNEFLAFYESVIDDSGVLKELSSKCEGFFGLPALRGNEANLNLFRAKPL